MRIVEMYGHDEFWQREMVWARAVVDEQGKFLMPAAYGNNYHHVSELEALSNETVKFRLKEVTPEPPCQDPFKDYELYLEDLKNCS